MPPLLEQLHTHDPAPVSVTGEALPLLHKFVVGKLLRVLLLADPHTADGAGVGEGVGIICVPVYGVPDATPLINNCPHNTSVTLPEASVTAKFVGWVSPLTMVGVPLVRVGTLVAGTQGLTPSHDHQYPSTFC